MTGLNRVRAVNRVKALQAVKAVAESNRTRGRDA